MGVPGTLCCAVQRSCALAYTIVAAVGLFSVGVDRQGLTDVGLDGCWGQLMMGGRKYGMVWFGVR